MQQCRYSLSFLRQLHLKLLVGIVLFLLTVFSLGTLHTKQDYPQKAHAQSAPAVMLDATSASTGSNTSWQHTTGNYPNRLLVVEIPVTAA
jgi:hypothetical protein